MSSNKFQFSKQVFNLNYTPEQKNIHTYNRITSKSILYSIFFISLLTTSKPFVYASTSPIAGSVETFSPQPTPLPNQCQSESAVSSLTLLVTAYTNDVITYRYIENSPETVPQCLENHVGAAYSRCLGMVFRRAAAMGFPWGSTLDKLDDCMAGYLYYAITNPNQLPGYAMGIYGAMPISNPNITLYLNDSCIESQEPDEQNALCSAARFEWAQSNWFVSPVSLIWDPNINISEIFSITSFPLDPAKLGNYFTWKASAETPLLVFDPKHVGIINSAEQLFGNWTFGGKKHISNGVSAKIPWRDGFEALASMDLNKDEKISGAELSALALWFDNNQDGISQAGEVKRLDEVQVIALYFKVDHTDPKDRSIFVNKGFERVVDGRHVTGRSVDWYGDSASSKEELSVRRTTLQSFCTNGSQINDSIYPYAGKGDLNRTSSGSQRTKLSGVWSWKMDVSLNHDKLRIPQGYFTFGDSESEGELKGHSYVQMKFADNSKKLNSMLMIATLKGTKSGHPASERIEFSTTDDKGQESKSTARIYRQGKVLKGQTTATILSNRKPSIITYNWTAKKLF